VRLPNLSWLARLVASFAVVVLLVWLVPTGDYVQVFGQVDPTLAALALAALLPDQMVKAHIFWLMARLQQLVLSYWQMLTIQFATGFYGLIVPGHVGAVVARWYKLQRPGRQGIEAAAVIALNRLLEATTGMLIGIGLALADPVAQQHTLILLFLVAASVGSFVVIGAFASSGGRARLRAWQGALPNWRLLRPARRLIPAVSDAAQRFSTMRRSQFAMLVFWSLVFHAIGILMVVLAARAVGSDVSWTTLGWIRSFLAIALLVPVSWAGLGLREIGFVALLTPYGVPAATAVTIGMFGSLRYVLHAVIGGLIELVGLWRRQAALTVRSHATKPSL